MTDALSTDPRDDAPDAPDYPAEQEALTGQSSKSSSAGSVENGGFTVALTLELETMHIPLRRLQALREGAVLPVDTGEGNIPVRVLAGGRTIAHGTLVSVGPGYGVLIGPKADPAAEEN